MGASQANPPAEGSRPRSRMRRMLSFLLTLAIAYVVFLGVACTVQRKLVFPRHVIEPVSEAASARSFGGETWWLETDAGRVEAWLLPGDGVSGETPGPAILFAHGNGEVIDSLPPQVEPFRRMGITVLLAEYRGYGRSEGSPSQAGIVDDFVAFYDRLADRPEVDEQRMVLHGRSIGTGVVCGVAARRTPAVMILQSPFTSVASIMAGYGIPRPLVRDPFDNAAVLADFDKPVLIQHGRADSIIPYHHSEQLHEITAQSTLIGYDAGHNDFPVHTPAYREDVRQFLADHAIIETARAE